MAEDFPDFTRAVHLLGVDAAGNLVRVLVDSAGNLTALMKGAKPDSVLATVALDASGRIIMVPYGTTTVAGTATVSQAEKDREMQGADGATLRTVAVDANGQMILVPRGQSGNYMSVDASGFLTAVLKGLRDGILTTIGVDSEGRIEAFGLDAEDQWGQVLKTGNSEMAARLGAVKTWDWRGQVAWQNDFSRGVGNGLKYLYGTGAAISVVPDYWQTGGYSLKFVAGSTAERKSIYRFGVEAPPSLKVGLEICFSFPGTFEFVSATLECWAGGKTYKVGIRYEETTYKVQYLNSANAWATLCYVYYMNDPYYFHRLKVVADFGAVRYKRALFFRTDSDLSAQATYQSGTGNDSRLVVEVELRGRSGYNDVAYLDSIIVTTAEPD